MRVMDGRKKRKSKRRERAWTGFTLAAAAGRG
jgi:hypothetical protein